MPDFALLGVRILVLNAGSSSLKYAVYVVTATGVQRDASGQFDFDTASGGAKRWKHDGHELTCAGITRRSAPAAILKLVEPIDACVHRIVMGGVKYNVPFLITPEAMKELEALVPLAPLHQPANLDGVRDVERALAEAGRAPVPQIGSPDTGKHRTIPAIRTRLPVADEWAQRGVRRYGFHGHSIAYIARWLAEHAPELRRVVVAHLGNGSSITALLDGESIDTSMGLTPLDGCIMGSRPGNLDPGVVLFMLDRLMHNEAYWHAKPRELYAALSQALNRESGLKALAGDADMVKLLERVALAEKEAIDVLAMWAESVAKNIATMAVSLGGVDALVITAGIGERGVRPRLEVVRRLGFLGFCIDKQRNENPGPTGRVESFGKPIFVVPTDEELIMAEAAVEVLASTATRTAA